MLTTIGFTSHLYRELTIRGEYASKRKQLAIEIHFEYELYNYPLTYEQHLGL
jgi:hypothetical protein